MQETAELLVAVASSIWRMSWHASVVIVLICLVRWALRRWTGPTFSYGIWLILLARLVIPVLPGSDFSIFNLLIKPQATAASPLNPDTWPTQSVGLALLSLMWLLGAVLFLARSLWTYIRLTHRVQTDSEPIDAATLAVLNDCRQSLGITSPVRMMQTSAIETPALMGYWRPRILIPRGLTDHISRQELRFVLMHELLHLKRNDVALNWLIIWIRSLHWFNPLLHWAAHQMISDRETLRDAQVICGMSQDDQSDYGRTILELALRAGRAHPHIVTAGLIHSSASLQRRIHMIAHPTKTSVGRIILSSAAALALALTCLTSGQLQAQSTQSPAMQPGTQTSKAPCPEHMGEKCDKHKKKDKKNKWKKKDKDKNANKDKNENQDTQGKQEGQPAE